MQKQLAFQIVLRALAPVTQDLDFQSGIIKMGTVKARSFDFAAVSFMSRLLNASTMCGELQDFVSDCQGRLHGQLYITKDDEMVHLNDVLIEAKFAEESEEKLQKDLVETASMPMSSKKVKVQLSDSEEDFDVPSVSCPDLKWFEKVDMKDKSAPDMAISQIPTSVRDLSDTSGFGRGKRLQKCPDENVGVGTIPKCTTSQTVEPKGRLAYLRKLVGNNKSKISSKNTTNTPPLETKQQEMVRMFREQLEMKYSEEDEFSLWNDLKKDPPESKGKPYLLPGGVLKGKFHEALLQNIPQGSIPGPRTREALAQFVCSRGQNSSVPDVSTRQKLGLDLEEQINQGNFQS